MITDITLPIGEPEHLAALALGYRARGFASYKVKVGKSREADRAVLTSLARVIHGARVRLDANEGFSADDALRLLDDARSLGLVVECFEQPCSRNDTLAMARVTAEGGVPVVADESCRSLDDVERIAGEGLAHAVNLKLVKLGGVRESVAVGRRARALGLDLMAGAMVETRLGLSAMAHVVTALGGVEWLDLDTAFLLADDPFRGGYHADGATLTLVEAPGLGVTRAG
jgi:L-alanine-DL-glutamate epimerase-like enolase superfamily enzyme